MILVPAMGGSVPWSQRPLELVSENRAPMRLVMNRRELPGVVLGDI